MPIPSDNVVKVLMQQRAELIGYAWLVVGDPDLAEDVFQEVSVAAIRKREEIDDAEHLMGWLYNAIRLQGLKVRRQLKQDRQLLSPEMLGVLQQARVQSIEPNDSDQMTALRECVNRLQGVTRSVLEMRYGQNQKPAAIAQSTGKNIQTVYKIITRAHSALRDCMRDRLSKDGGSS